MDDDETALDFNEWSKQFDNAMGSALDESLKASSPPYPGRSPPGLPTSMNSLAQKLFSPGTKQPPKASTRRAWRKNSRRKNSSKAKPPASDSEGQDVEMQDGFMANSEEDENSMEGYNEAEPNRFSPNLDVRRKRRVKPRGQGKGMSKQKRPTRPAVPPPTPPISSPPPGGSLGEIGVGLLGLAKGLHNESISTGSASFATGVSGSGGNFADIDTIKEESKADFGFVAEEEGESEEERERVSKARKYGREEPSVREEKRMEVNGLGGLNGSEASTRVESMTDEDEATGESPRFSLGSFNVLKKRLNRSLRARNAVAKASGTTSRSNSTSRGRSKEKAKAQEEVGKGLKLAMEMMNAKEYGEAVKVLDHLLAYRVNTCVLLMHHALCALKLEAFTQVVDDFESIERSFEARTGSLLPSMLTLQYAGEALVRLGSHDLASAFLDRAKEALVGNPGVTGLKPSIYLSSIQSLFTENAEAQARVASIDMELSGLNRATVVKCAEELLRVSPGSPRSYLVLILGKFVLGSADEAWARKKMQKALAPALGATGLLLVDLLKSQLGDAVASCAKMLHRSGLMDEAHALLQVLLHALTEALEGAVNNDEVRLGCLEVKANVDVQLAAFDVFRQAKARANERFRRGDYAGCVALYGEAMEIDRTHKFFNSVMLCNRAAALMALNKFAAAEEDCSMALRHRARYVRARVRRARCRVALGKLEGAVQDFRMAYEMEKDEEVLAELRRVELTQKARARANSSYGGQYSRSSMPGDGFSYSKYHERAKRFHSQQTRGRRESEREHDPHHNYYRYSKYTYYSSSTPRKEREKQRERKAPWSESTLRRKELDPYATLGVSCTDSSAVIRKAYLKLCLKYHPDKNPNGEDMYKKVQQAFDILKDRSAREEYDRKERMRRRHSTYGGFS